MGQLNSQFRSKSTVIVFVVLAAIGSIVILYYNKYVILLPDTEKGLQTKDNTNSSNSKPPLPSLENGGIVFFVHIPKTGGTTIRELIKWKRGGMRSKVHYIYLTGPKEYAETVQNMKEWLGYGTGMVEDRNHQPMAAKVVFVEYHALERDCPSFLELSQTTLPQWKELADENNLPFFALSIVREPVSFAISYFNFYHGMRQNPRRYDYLGENATEDDFVRWTIANPQCLFLAYGEHAYSRMGQDLRNSLTIADCIKAFRAMLDMMDWIGTTETIGTDTLPLLKELFSTNNSTNSLIRTFRKKANPSSTPIHRGFLSNKTIKHVRKITQWDQEFYDRVNRGFSYKQ